MTFGFEAGVGFFLALVLCGAILANIEVVLGVLFFGGGALVLYVIYGTDFIIGTAVIGGASLITIALCFVIPRAVAIAMGRSGDIGPPRPGQKSNSVGRFPH